jgi:hypothetical protein
MASIVISRANRHNRSGGLVFLSFGAFIYSVYNNIRDEGDILLNEKEINRAENIFLSASFSNLLPLHKLL